MNEIDFIEQITHYGLKVRDVIIPTSAVILLYGDKQKTKIIKTEHHEHFYSLVKKLEISDSRMTHLRNNGMTDIEILNTVRSEYDAYLKELRRQIISLQKSWSDSYAQQRAKYIIDYLGYRNIYWICELVVQRNVPYELVLELIFETKSIYGQFRTPKPKKDIYVDPRIKKVLEGQELIPVL